MIKGIISDIDGTLIDSMPIWENLGARYLSNAGIEPEEGLGAILFPMSIDEGVRYLKIHYNLSESEESIRAGLIGIIDRFYREEVQLKDGAADFLKRANDAGIRMILATAGDLELEKAALKRLGILKYFERIFTCEELETSKKSAVIYEKAAEYMGYIPSDILVIEDIYTAIHSAHTAGFKVAAIKDEASFADIDKICLEADCYGKFENIRIDEF